MPEEILLVVGSGGRVFSKPLGVEDLNPASDETTTWWQSSHTLPAARICMSYEIYHGVWLFAAQADDRYELFRTIDRRTFTKVFSFPSEVLQILQLDTGLGMILTREGLYVSLDTGWSWSRADAEPIPTGVTRIAAVRIDSVSWALFAYSLHKKVYRADVSLCERAPVSMQHGWAEAFGAIGLDDLPSAPASLSSWELVLDESAYTGRFHPALAANPIAVFAGIGGHLKRSLDLGASWDTVNSFDGVIRDLNFSDNSRFAELAMVLERPQGNSQFMRSRDLGESFTVEANRIEPIASVQSVIPTATPDLQTSYIVLGRRAESELPMYKILKGGDLVP